MIPGQTVEIDEPCDGECHLAGHDPSAPRTPCRDIMLSGWPDSLTACNACAARLLRLELDLTRDCALCGGPIQRHAVNGRVDGRKFCYCRGRRTMKAIIQRIATEDADILKKLAE